jgi:hypothetical protein
MIPIDKIFAFLSKTLCVRLPLGLIPVCAWMWIYPSQEKRWAVFIAAMTLSVIIGTVTTMVIDTYLWVKEYHDERHRSITDIARDRRQNIPAYSNVLRNMKRKMPDQRQKRNKK